MVDQWFYASGTDRLGPFSGRQLKDLGAQGILLPTDTVWKEGVEQGVSANRIKNLFPSVPVPSTIQVKKEEPAPETNLAVAEATDQKQETPPTKKYVPVISTKKKGRATAVTGAVIIGQDGEFVQYKKKCVLCGLEDATRNRMPIRNGVTRENFYCPKCRKMGTVAIQGITGF
jgi:hypothetical protein